MPGEASPAASFAPRVYIPLQNLAQTNLLKPGSLARYLNFVKFAPNVDVAAEVQKLAPRIEQAGLEYDTVAKRKKDLGESLDNLYRFLNLVGFISLLLGAVGVASAIQAHLQQKMRTAADPALPRRGRPHHRRGLPAPGDGDGSCRGAGRRGAWPDDASILARRAAEVHPFPAPTRDRVDTGLGRHGGRLGDLHSLRAPAAPAFPAGFAAPRSARVGR